MGGSHSSTSPPPSIATAPEVVRPGDKLTLRISPTFVTAAGSEVEFEELSLLSGTDAHRYAGSARFRGTVEAALAGIEERLSDARPSGDFHVRQVFATTEPPFRIVVEGELRDLSAPMRLDDVERAASARLSVVTWDVIRGMLRYRVRPGTVDARVTPGAPRRRP